MSPRAERQKILKESNHNQAKATERGQRATGKGEKSEELEFHRTLSSI